MQPRHWSISSSKMDLLTRLHIGGGAGKMKPPPPPPSPTTAAENVAKARILERNRRATGYGQTLFASLAPAQDQAGTMIKKLLGQ